MDLLCSASLWLSAITVIFDIEKEWLEENHVFLPATLFYILLRELSKEDDLPIHLDG